MRFHHGIVGPRGREVGTDGNAHWTLHVLLAAERRSKTRGHSPGVDNNGSAEADLGTTGRAGWARCYSDNPIGARVADRARDCQTFAQLSARLHSMPSKQLI